MIYSSIKNVLNLFLFSALGFSVQLFEKKKKSSKVGYGLTLKCSLAFYKHNFHKRRQCAPLCVRVTVVTGSTESEFVYLRLCSCYSRARCLPFGEGYLIQRVPDSNIFLIKSKKKVYNFQCRDFRYDTVYS